MSQIKISKLVNFWMTVSFFCVITVILLGAATNSVNSNRVTGLTPLQAMSPVYFLDKNEPPIRTKAGDTFELQIEFVDWKAGCTPLLAERYIHFLGEPAPRLFEIKEPKDFPTTGVPQYLTLKIKVPEDMPQSEGNVFTRVYHQCVGGDTPPVVSPAYKVIIE